MGGWGKRLGFGNVYYSIEMMSRLSTTNLFVSAEFTL